MARQKLALFGGTPSLEGANDDGLFTWPVLDDEARSAAVGVLDHPNFEGSGNVAALEREFAAYCGVRYAVGQVNGTSAVLAALWAAGVRRGDEVIVPSTTYWATAMPALSLGAEVVFADVRPHTMNLDPVDVEKRITHRTRAIVAVHMLGYPADMDRFRDLGRRHGIAVVEDASHAHGSRFAGARTGSLGDVAAFSFSGKPIAVGEGGIVVTDDRDTYERVLAWGQNFRFNEEYVRNTALLRWKGLPLGGVTSRLHPISAALARVQLRRLDDRMAEVDAAMTRFWDGLRDVPGLIAHRPPEGDDRTMGAWYQPHGIYDADALDGLSANGFIRAVRAEGFPAHTRNIIREPLHLHPVFASDVYAGDLPSDRPRTGPARTDPAAPGLPVSEGLRAFTVPPFKRYDEQRIDRYVEMFRNVAERHTDLLDSDPGDAAVTVDSRGNG
ncbi:DegT/DnrJ/EryC1/StrS family aminotransferase [Kitasatospora sp. NPDC058444]|uniref:DegT/DnrJ/EryC1/StrS family aminotransferase n=1 Tax=Kitasatospora sp. NPDC058444 TaxID=3346504 RepID=UPI003651E6E4